jgi:polar amino acid transport system substrate-binding protein
MRIAPEVIARFSPTGALRAAINVGNPILAPTDPATGVPCGVSVELAHEFARRLDIESMRPESPWKR